MQAEQAGKKRIRRKKAKIHEVNAGNDKRFLGPLNYQHFQILGWICIAVSQAAVLLALGCRLDENVRADSAELVESLQFLGSLSLPLLLIANFAQILNPSEGYRRQLIRNAGAMLAVCLGFYAVYYHFLLGGIQMLAEDPENVPPLAEALVHQLLPQGFLAINLFADLFLCTLVMLFLNYRPTRVFVGKGRIIFRLFALLPIVYEILCMILKIRSSRGEISLPVWMYPLLPMKPPMTFVLFVTLAVFVKTREFRFRRHGRTHEEYKAFLKTRRNSWNFSVFLAIMMVIVAVADAAVMYVYSLNEGFRQIAAELNDTEQMALIEEQIALMDNGSDTALALPEERPATHEPETEAGMPEGIGETEFSEEEAKALMALMERLEDKMKAGQNASNALGFGGSIPLVFLAPLVLLFSYTREPRLKKYGMFIPMAGIALIILVWLEGLRMGLTLLPLPKFNVSEMMQGGLQ